MVKNEKVCILVLNIALVIATCLLCISITGCESTKLCEPVIVTKEVKIPVYQPLEIPERDFPVLPVNQLTLKSTDKETAVAYDKTVNILINEVKFYRKLIQELNRE